MVADALVYHPSVSHYLKFVATTVGRDKLMRAVQYFSRFYAWYLLRTNATPSAIKPYTALKGQFGLIRKALRLGKSVEHVKAAAQAWDAPSRSSPALADGLLRALAIGRQLGYAGYMAADNVAFIDAAGISALGETGKLAQRLAFRCWFAGLACNALAGTYQLLLLRQREAGIDRKEGEGALDLKRVERERMAVNLQLLSDLCDITVPSFALGYDSGYLDDGLVGLAGVVSSLIGVYSVWVKVA